MKKRVLRIGTAVYAVMAAVFLLVANFNAFAGARQDTKESSGPVTVNYYGRPDANKVESTIVANFEKLYPDIKVNYVELPDSSNDKLKVINTVLQAGDSSIDVFAGDVSWPSIFVSADWLEPLDNYLKKEEFDIHLSSMLSAFQMNGKTYGLPIMADSGAMYYRKDLLEKYHKSVPSTWDELIAASIEIIKGENNPDLCGLSSYWMQNESLTCAFLEIYWALGGSLVRTDGKSAVDKNKVTAALSTMKGMISENKIAAKGIETFNTNNSRAVVSAGNAVFARDWLSGYAPYNDSKTSKVAGNMEIYPLPAGGTLGGWGVMVSNYSKNKEAAVLLAKYRAGYEGQKTANELARIVPTIKSMYEDADVLKLTPHLPKFFPVMDKARPRGLTSYYAEISGIMQREIHSVISGMISPETGAVNITSQVNEILK